ncbi:MAG: hypothetical protein SynsKO_36900 [Synoicihabitans sp.]
MKSRSYLVLCLAFTSTLFTGCSVIDSHTETRISGQVVSDDAFAAIQPGFTTEEELWARLGEPESVVRKSNGDSELIYRSKSITRKDTELLFVIDASSKTERIKTVAFTVRDGVVDMAEQKSVSRNLDVGF